MWIETFISSAATGKMFGCQRNELGIDRIALKPVNDSSYGLGSKGRIFSKGTFTALPSGFGQQVGHIHIAFPHTYRQPFLPGHVGKLLDQSGVTHSRQSNFGRPFGKANRSGSSGTHPTGGNMVAGIGS